MLREMMVTAQKYYRSLDLSRYECANTQERGGPLGLAVPIPSEKRALLVKKNSEEVTFSEATCTNEVPKKMEFISFVGFRMRIREIMKTLTEKNLQNFETIIEYEMVGVVSCSQLSDGGQEPTIQGESLQHAFELPA